MPDPDTLAELLEAHRGVRAAERDLEQLELTDPDRPAAEAALKQAQERYARAVQAQEENVRRERDG
jgi:hypothetical protein